MDVYFDILRLDFLGKFVLLKLSVQIKRLDAQAIQCLNHNAATHTHLQLLKADKIRGVICIYVSFQDQNTNKALLQADHQS